MPKIIKTWHRLFFRSFFFRFPDAFERHFRALSNHTRTVLKNAFRPVSERFSELFSNSSPTLLKPFFFYSSRAIKQFDLSSNSTLLELFSDSTQTFFFTLLEQLSNSTSRAIRLFSSNFFVLRRSANLVSAPSGAPHTGTNLVSSYG